MFRDASQAEDSIEIRIAAVIKLKRSPSVCPADDQASVQASGLWTGGRDGHQGAGLLQTHRLGSAGEPRDPTAV